MFSGRHFAFVPGRDIPASLYHLVSARAAVSGKGPPPVMAATWLTRARTHASFEQNRTRALRVSEIMEENMRASMSRSIPAALIGASLAVTHPSHRATSEFGGKRDLGDVPPPSTALTTAATLPLWMRCEQQTGWLRRVRSPELWVIPSHPGQVPAPAHYAPRDGISGGPRGQSRKGQAV
jgi:hypothetical protein